MKITDLNEERTTFTLTQDGKPILFVYPDRAVVAKAKEIMPDKLFNTVSHLFTDEVLEKWDSDNEDKPKPSEAPTVLDEMEAINNRIAGIEESHLAILLLNGGL